MTNTIDREVELTVARASAVMFQTYFFDVNSTGGLLGYGRSIICGPDGEILHQAGTAKEIIPIIATSSGCSAAAAAARSASASRSRASATRR